MYALSLSVLKPNAPLPVTDVLDATRVVLRQVQRPAYMAWRTERWWSDEQLAKEIHVHRHLRAMDMDTYDPQRCRPEWTALGLPVAQDILIVCLTDTPQRVISSLEQLGIHHADASNADLLTAFTLIDSPDLFDAIRLTGVRLDRVRPIVATVGRERFLLLHAARLTGAEIESAITEDQVPSVETLQVMVALTNG